MPQLECDWLPVTCSPLKRLGHPEEVAKVALFLASDDHRLSWGQRLLRMVDGS